VQADLNRPDSGKSYFSALSFTLLSDREFVTTLTVIFGIDLVLLSFVIVGILAFVLLTENVISAVRGISNHESKL